MEYNIRYSIYVCVHVSMCEYECIHMCDCAFMHGCILCICLYTLLYIYMCVCFNVYASIDICSCMHKCVHMFVYKYVHVRELTCVHICMEARS